MISNTNCSEVKSGIFPGDYQQKFQLNNLTSSNGNNNNNSISNNKNSNTGHILQSTKPFTFYTGNDVGDNSGVVFNGNPAEKVVQIFNTSINESPPTAKQNQYHEQSFYTLEQGVELPKKIFGNESALIDVGTNECEIFTFTSIKEENNDSSAYITRTNSNNSSSESSNIDQRKPQMCRTKDQENAFRQIEDVHNYSKLNRYGYCNDNNDQATNVHTYSSNSSNQDEDDDEEDDGEEDEEEYDVIDYEQHLHAKVRKLSAMEQQSVMMPKNVNSEYIIEQVDPKKGAKLKSQEVDVKIKIEDEDYSVPPDHHARRPMNAFLIFCKRHRGIVKDKYKNFENRSITKILGEWWASMDANDKKCYVNLAKQNKDAFFSANPNFKWYKLPAPSLRTLNTRPGNVDRSCAGSSEYQCDNNCSQDTHNTDSPSIVYNRSQPQKVSYFKLADETQMGELNSLMRPNATSSANDALQEALGETSDYFKTGCKRKSPTNFEDLSTIKRFQSDNSFSSGDDDQSSKKSVRSCKGKKYIELMNSGQIATVTSKKQTSPKSPKIISQSFVMQNDSCNKGTLIPKDEQFLPKKDTRSRGVEEYILPDCPNDYGSPCKQQFNFGSFDLEDKIKCLPAQCLETYLQRKKNTKRKKKINAKKRSPTQNKTETVLKKTSQNLLIQPKTAIEAKEQIVGSQKRKARKESITRRDINSTQNDVQTLLRCTPLTSAYVERDVDTVPQNTVNHNTTSDLLILAEVAANRTEIAQ